MFIVTIPKGYEKLAHEFGVRGIKMAVGNAADAAVALWPPGAKPEADWVNDVVKRQIPVVYNEDTQLAEDCNGWITTIRYDDVSSITRVIERAVRQTAKRNIPIPPASPLPPPPPPPAEPPTAPPTPATPPAEDTPKPSAEVRVCALPGCGTPLKKSQDKFCSQSCVGKSRRKKK